MPVGLILVGQGVLWGCCGHILGSLIRIAKMYARRPHTAAPTMMDWLGVTLLLGGCAAMVVSLVSILMRLLLAVGVL